MVLWPELGSRPIASLAATPSGSTRCAPITSAVGPTI